MLQLLKIQGLGPKTIALIWSAYQVCDLEGVEKLAREGKIRELPRMGEKHEQKLLKAIEDYRRIARPLPASTPPKSRPRRLIEHLQAYPGIDKITPAGSLRRGRETVGDLDILVTGRGLLSTTPNAPRLHRAHRSSFPALMESSPEARTRSASACAAACRWTFACFLPIPSARPCSISPDRRRTMSLCASAR